MVSPLPAPRDSAVCGFTPRLVSGCLEFIAFEFEVRLTEFVMRKMLFTVIVPVYNRPQELAELLQSLADQSVRNFQVVVVDDGSTTQSDELIAQYTHQFPLRYIYQENAGPAAARNTGAKAVGNETDWLVFFDSDCLIPINYFAQAEELLASRTNIALFGGPDDAHPSFTPLQKAISYAMTSPFTTGGIRGGGERTDRFYPRTFNMGVRSWAFLQVGGFAAMRYGEDVDFSMRVIAAGHKAALLPQLFVYHKRRDTLWAFYRQVWHSGQARVTLSKRHRGTLRLVHLFPSLAVLLLIATFALSFSPYIVWAYLVILAYALLIFFHAWRTMGSVQVAFRALFACATMIIAYGLGFIFAAIGLESDDSL